MSRYEWERGDIVLPSAEWVKFRKSLITGFGIAQRQDFELLKKLHEQIAASIKGKRGVDVEAVVRQAVFATPGQFKVIDEFAAVKALLNKDEATGRCKLRSPRKQDFPDPKQSMTQFDAEDGRIHLDNDKRTVTWNVPENNHACDRARESYMGQLLFRLLGQVKWTRGSGGEIVGNDEYNRDARYEGGGANYVKNRFGPQKERRLVAVGWRPVRVAL